MYGLWIPSEEAVCIITKLEELTSYSTFNVSLKYIANWKKHGNILEISNFTDQNLEENIFSSLMKWTNIFSELHSFLTSIYKKKSFFFLRNTEFIPHKNNSLLYFDLWSKLSLATSSILNNRSLPCKAGVDKSSVCRRYYRKGTLNGSYDEGKPAPWSARYLLGYCLMLTCSNWVQSVVID